MPQLKSFRRLTALFLVAPLPCAADRIELNNGRTIEGLVREESENHIVLDLGVGTATFPKSNIRAVVRSDAEERAGIVRKWRQQHFLDARYVPKGLEELAAGFRQVSDARAQAVAAARELKRLDLAAEGQRRDLDALKQKLVAVSRQIKQASPEKDVKAYNALVVEMNSLQAEIAIRRDEIEKTAKLRDRQAERIASYLDELASYEQKFAAAAVKHRQGQPDENTSLFFDRIEADLKACASEFSETAVEAERLGRGAAVAVLANGKVQGRFLLDTGASMVSISESFAKRLGLDIRRGAADVVLADGSKVPAGAAVLSSLQVGDARVENVDALVLTSTPFEKVDGLLGMNFLRHFVVRIDGHTGKLVLRAFTPGESGVKPP